MLIYQRNGRADSHRDFYSRAELFDLVRQIQLRHTVDLSGLTVLGATDATLDTQSLPDLVSHVGTLAELWAEWHKESEVSHEYREMLRELDSDVKCLTIVPIFASESSFIEFDIRLMFVDGSAWTFPRDRDFDSWWDFTVATE
jgi:hypothetical protein